MRAPGHLDPLDVGQAQVRPHLAPQVHAVKIQAHRRIDGDDVVLGADAAHEHAGVILIAVAEIADEQVGNILADVEQIPQVQVGEILRGERGQRNGDVLQAFLPFSRCDDDFLEGAGAGP